MFLSIVTYFRAEILPIVIPEGFHDLSTASLYNGPASDISGR